ncbi:MBL fold metallo-hydrolase [Sporomusa aerivorans]|uniref:MBL fold metallo-hydrolase n=1 Tax=Sporomusa aerivorans TaxID=204936 RepID=UPI00352A7A35
MNHTAQLTVFGGAGEHGRACFHLQTKSLSLLLDCGAKKSGGGEYPLLSPGKIAGLCAVFLSHAHEDHAMAIPLLYKLGYRGKVWATRATMQKLPQYFSAWEQYAGGHGSLPYERRHIAQIRFACMEDTVSPGNWTELFPGLSVLWGKSGHTLGAIWLMLDMEGKCIFFSGDMSTEGRLLAADAPLARTTPAGSAASAEPVCDLAIVEAAYGPDDEDQQAKLTRLAQSARFILTKQGWLLLPVPFIGRGQDLLVWASESFPQTLLLAEEDLVVTLQQMLACPEWLRPGAAAAINRVLTSPSLRVIQNARERKKAMSGQPGGIILTGDGMLQTTAARWYYRQIQNHADSGVIFTGHLAAGSPGYRLWNSPAKSAAGCKVDVTHYKVHQGLNDVRQLLQRLPSRHAVFFHTGKAAADALCRTLSPECAGSLHSLIPGDTLNF